MSPPHDRKLLFTPPPSPSNATFAAINATSTPQPRPKRSNTTVSSPPHQQPFPPQLTPSTDHALNSSIALTILAFLTALFFMSFLSLSLRRVSTAFTSRHRGDDDPYPYPFPHSRHMLPSPPSLISPRPRRYYTRSDIPSCSTLRKGVDPRVLDALPVFSYRGETKYQVDCLICLGEFEEEERVKVIPCCEHVFHAECIDQWLRSNGSCPVCRDTQLTSSAVKNSLVESDRMCRP